MLQITLSCKKGVSSAPGTLSPNAHNENKFYSTNIVHQSSITYQCLNSISPWSGATDNSFLTCSARALVSGLAISCRPSTPPPLRLTACGDVFISCLCHLFFSNSALSPNPIAGFAIAVLPFSIGSWPGKAFITACPLRVTYWSSDKLEKREQSYYPVYNFMMS